MQRNHTLSERLPWLSMLIAFVLALFAMSPVGQVSPGGAVGYVAMCIVAVVVLLIQRWWFSPEYKGAFGSNVPAREYLIVLVPFLVFCVVSWILNIIDFGLYLNLAPINIASALSAGFTEEMLFRGVTIPIGMRYLKSKSKILVLAIVTSVVFGVMHFGNVTQGASVTMGVVQAFSTIFIGLFFAAAFIRTGNILFAIAVHAFYVGCASSQTLASRAASWPAMP